MGSRKLMVVQLIRGGFSDRHGHGSDRIDIPCPKHLPVDKIENREVNGIVQPFLVSISGYTHFVRAWARAFEKRVIGPENQVLHIWHYHFTLPDQIVIEGDDIVCQCPEQKKPCLIIRSGTKLRVQVT